MAVKSFSLREFATTTNLKKVCEPKSMTTEEFSKEKGVMRYHALRILKDLEAGGLIRKTWKMGARYPIPSWIEV